jgi:hypothetical protein
MRRCIEHATADAARHHVRQLRSDGELGLLLLMRVVTLAGADCGVLRERCRGRDHVFAVMEDEGGASAVGVAAVRLVQRADVRGQRVRRSHVAFWMQSLVALFTSDNPALSRAQANSLAALSSSITTR